MENSVGSATAGFSITGVSVVVGTGIGIGIDALVGGNPTVFRRSPAASHGIVLRLRKGGGAIGWSAAC